VLAWGCFWASGSTVGVLGERKWYWEPPVRQWWQWGVEKPDKLAIETEHVVGETGGRL